MILLGLLSLSRDRGIRRKRRIGGTVEIALDRSKDLLSVLSINPFTAPTDCTGWCRDRTDREIWGLFKTSQYMIFQERKSETDAINEIQSSMERELHENHLRGFG